MFSGSIKHVDLRATINFMNFYHKIRNHICTVELQDTSGTNTIDETFCRGLRDFIDTMQWDPDIRVWIITSNTPNVFSTGRHSFEQDDSISFSEMQREIEVLQISKNISEIPAPVIIAIDGEVSDHGLEMALAGDLRLVTDVSTFSINANQTNFPWDNGIPMLISTVGRSLANDMLYTHRILSASEALAAGLATRITTRTEFLGQLEYITDNLKSLSPSSLKLIKEAVKTGASLPFTAALNFEGDLSVLLQSTEDRAEGLRAFFQKRRAKFTGD
ncbi:MAG: enoyl-CoA hydratase-related protein [Dehalococcoidia bacterium]|jgi:enoyl-CoA hydratase/carnithine racemase|nr:enoyl-CoA hydratase-related protein [Dehalococcoidia bacterium]|tara:strand:- start:27736 stop:28557 length:822 start_codon:yes stop_codon:yes gene_type:complete